MRTTSFLDRIGPKEIHASLDRRGFLKEVRVVVTLLAAAFVTGSAGTVSAAIPRAATASGSFAPAPPSVTAEASPILRPSSGVVVPSPGLIASPPAPLANFSIQVTVNSVTVSWTYSGNGSPNTEEKFVVYRRDINGTM